MDKAHSILVGTGYKNLKDTAKFKPYDYTGERDGKDFFVEVKGTQTPGKTLILTSGEVEHIGSHADQCIAGEQLRGRHIQNGLCLLPRPGWTWKRSRQELTCR